MNNDLQRKEDDTVFYVNIEEFNTKNIEKFIDSYADALKHMLGIQETKLQIDVSKIWVNPFTYKKFETLVKKALKSKKKSSPWVMLQIGPACDLNDSMNIGDDNFLVRADYLREPDANI